MKNKLLLVPGQAKGGTTFFYDQLAKHRDCFNLPKSKEINYFSRHVKKSENKYLTFFPNHTSDKWFIDASPVYFQSPHFDPKELRSTLAEWDITVFVFLRNPVSYIYSHYLHDLKSHIGRLSSPKAQPLTFNLEDPSILEKYSVNYWPFLNTFRDMDGVTLKVFAMHDLFNGVVEAAVNKLGLPQEIRLDASQKSNVGGFVPKFYYGGEPGHFFYQDQKKYVVPEGALISACGQTSEIKYDVSEKLALDYFRRSASFTRELTISSDIIATKLDDHQKCCEAFGLNLPIQGVENGMITWRAPDGKVSDKILKEIADHA